MASLSKPALLSGGPSFFPHSTTLRAGPLTLLLEAGEIRRVLFGDREILRRIYLTVRGPDWSTMVPAVRDLEVEPVGEGFRASWTLAYRLGPARGDAGVDFTWSVTAEGNAQGTLRVAARGRANIAFATNRVGICVLHPPACAGKTVRLGGPAGPGDGVFPAAIAPREPFTGFREFTHDLEGGLRLRLSYSGETFETEDQRNWTDGSFKTYCPPQAEPKPRRLAAGWEASQEVTLELPGASAPAAVPEAVLSRDGSASRPLPAVGFGLPSHGIPSGPRDRARLQALVPAHLRLNLRLSLSGWEMALEGAVSEASALGAPLEVAVVAGADFAADLAALAAAFRRVSGRAARWLIFSEAADATPEPLFTAARQALRDLSPGAEFALGSKSDFVLLNRGFTGRALPADAKAAYAVTPQVHLFDNKNLAESLEGQEWTLRTVAEKWPENGSCITPVTLKRSPFAVASKKPAAPDASAWRAQADARQLSLFGAGWTLGCFSVLAAGGARSATFYETTGVLGLLAGETCGLPDRSFAGTDLIADPAWAYPLYHVFADLADFRGGEFLPWTSSAPLRFRGFGLRRGGRECLLVANLERVTAKLRLDFPERPAALRRLRAENALQAMEDPEGWRARGGDPWAGGAQLELGPFEIVRFDFQP